MAVNVEYILSLKDQFSKGIDDAKKSADGLDSKMSSLKSGMKNVFSGMAVGAGIGAFNMLSGAVVSFAQNAIKEFEEAVLISKELERTLKSVGQEKYFEDLVTEASDLAGSLHNLFDNDEIIVAQTKLINYGKITRAEISKLIPVIADLAVKEGVDLAQATESVINIMAGRGGATLRQYGLSVKGTETAHERLNLVLGDFQQKLIGSADTYAKTAQGIEQTNKVMLANIEENFGKSFSNLKMKVLPVVTDILNGINLMMESNDDIRTRMMGVGSTKFVGIYKTFTPEQIEREKKDVKDKAKEMFQVYNQIAKDEIKLTEVNNGKRSLLELNGIETRLKKNKKLLDDGTYEVGVKQNALNRLVAKNDNAVINPSGKDTTKATGKGLASSTKTDSKKTRAVGTNATRSQATGSKSITINVSIKDLIGTNNMNITNIKEGANKLQDMVVGALTGAVNDFQLIVE